MTRSQRHQPPPTSTEDPRLEGTVSERDTAPLPVERLSLVIVSHPETAMLGRSIDLPAGRSVVIGRGPGADVDFSECTDVSRAHARIWEEDGVVRIEDLGSSNGTSVNGGSVLVGPRVLASGDGIQIGSIYLKFFAGNHVERTFYQAMYELASRDELTGVHNRRRFEEELEREFALTIRYRRPLTLTLLDIDGFKAINDRHGHRAGDAVLRQLAAVVGRELRRDVVFARLGGDEFALICRETDAAAAGAMVDRLREAIGRHRFDVDSRELVVTCSFGLAEASPEMAGPDDLFEAADAELYAGKPGGSASPLRPTTVAPAMAVPPRSES